MTYHIKIDYQPEIEINSEDLIRRIKSKEIPSHAMLKSAKEGEWRPLESYPEFSLLTPPPLPQTSEVLKTESPKIAEKVSSNKKTSVLAILSLACGIISFAGATIFSAIPAIILGHISLRKISSNSNLKGKVLARSGIILGYLLFVAVAIVMGSIAFPAVSKSLDKARQITDSKDKKTNSSLQQIKGKGLDYTFYVPSDWKVQFETAGFDSVAASSNEIFGVIIQDSEYDSMSNLVDEVVTKAESKGAYDIQLAGLSRINAVDWTIIRFKHLKNDKVNDCAIYLISQHGVTIRLGLTSNKTPLKDRMELFNQILESFKFPNSINP